MRPVKGWPKKVTCTKFGSTNYVKIPPTQRMVECGMIDYKSPKLIELHQFLFGVGFDGNEIMFLLLEKRYLEAGILTKLSNACRQIHQL